MTTHKFAELRDRIRSDPKRAARIDQRSREYAVIVAAFDFVVRTDRQHMPFCGVGFQNGSPCTCGLPELLAAVKAMDSKAG